MSWTFFPKECMVFEKIFYVAMLGLAIYFIVDGDIINKYRLKRTNFAVSEEDIPELPTIITAVRPLREKFKYNKDFHIVYRAGIFAENGDWKKLQLGKDKSFKDVSVRLQQLSPGLVSVLGLSNWRDTENLYKITHVVKYSARMHTDFTLKFIFKTEKASKVEISFMPEKISNSSYCEGKYQDGQPESVIGLLGEGTEITIATEKYKYLNSSQRICRESSYSSLLGEKLLKGLKENCTALCKKTGGGFCDAARANDEISNLPDCKENQIKCFHETIWRVKEDLKKSSGLCEKLNFRIKQARTFPPKNGQTLFRVILDPPKMVVNEEYLIYDMVAFVSAIGGTLGLCVGFSFTGYASTFLRFFEKLLNKIRNNMALEEDSA